MTASTAFAVKWHSKSISVKTVAGQDRFAELSSTNEETKEFAIWQRECSQDSVPRISWLFVGSYHVEAIRSYRTWDAFGALR
jgi:hypothetical protein